jgi:hypothetical protein
MLLPFQSLSILSKAGSVWSEDWGWDWDWDWDWLSRQHTIINQHTNDPGKEIDGWSRLIPGQRFVVVRQKMVLFPGAMLEQRKHM